MFVLGAGSVKHCSEFIALTAVPAVRLLCCLDTNDKAGPVHPGVNKHLLGPTDIPAA